MRKPNTHNDHKIFNIGSIQAGYCTSAVAVEVTLFIVKNTEKARKYVKGGVQH